MSADQLAEGHWVEVVCVIFGGGAVVVIKRKLLHRRRPEDPEQDAISDSGSITREMVQQGELKRAPTNVRPCGGSSAAVGMAATPLRAHQAGRH